MNARPRREAPETPENYAGADPAARLLADRPLRCAQCLAPITSERERILRNGNHRHVFSNPYGLVFEIGCFARAPGCAAVGPETPDFSWFAGTRWQIVICARCGHHLGWRYAGHPDGPFHGLILPRLRAGSGL